MKLSSLKLRIAWSSAGSQGVPAMSGNQRRSSVGGVLADALDVGVHREAQRIGVDAAVGAVAHGRLEDHVGVRLASHSIITPSVRKPSSYRC
jgi:hypothetical protein